MNKRPKLSYNGNSFTMSGKHKNWKGERIGLFIRVPVDVVEELRDEARQKQQHFNDIAVKRLQTNGK